MESPRNGLARLRRAADSGALDAFCARHDIRALTVFGSAARDEPEARDLDIGVLFERGAVPDLLAVIEDLDGFTEAPNDVVNLNHAGPVLRERALAGSVWLFESEVGALATAAAAAIGERIDTDPMRRLDLELLAE